MSISPAALHPRKLHVVDSHTAGEPTRVIVDGGPDLGAGTILERGERFRTQYDRFRSAVVNEPRGSDVMVGAMLLEPLDPTCAVGVIFFNNVGALGMCGHGTMGVMATLAHLGRASPGRYRIETVPGVVTATLHDANRVSVENVASFRHAQNVSIEVDGYGKVTGDVAWGGNWFFLVHEHGQQLEYSNIEALTDFSWRVRRGLKRARITGPGCAGIDHIELISPSPTPRVHARNFVLCPGGAYDRSPCGTGTSAKVACLIADGKLKPGEAWRQESIIGSVFEVSAEIIDGAIIPTITGSAFVTGEATLLLNTADPYCWGIATPKR